MRNLYLIVFILVLSFHQVNAQEHNFSFSYSIGRRAFSMNSLKKFNTLYIKQLNFDARVVDAFPSNYYNTISFLQKIHNNFYFGLEYSNASTGSRIHYQDYSGVYVNDYILNSNSIGFLSEVKIFSYKKLYLNGNIGLSIISSKMRTHENCTINNSELWDSKNTYKSDEVGFSIGISPKYSFSNHLSMGFNFAYLVSSSGRIHRFGNMELPYPGTLDIARSIVEEYFKTNWSGARVGLLITFNL